MLGLLSAGVSAVGAIAGGSAARSAASRAASAATRGYNQASGALQQGVGDAAGILQPYSNEGAGARSLINAALGVPQAQGGIAQSGIADEQSVYKKIWETHPDIQATVTKEIGNRKSQLYGMDPVQATKYLMDTNPTGQVFVDQAKRDLQGAVGPVASGPTQADANKVFQGTQYAQNANELSDSLWQPIGGERATYADSPWQGMSERATTRANDLFLGLAGSQGSVLSGNTARGLQENQAYIDDSFHGSYLDAYNNAATGSYNANTSAFNQWMAGLGDVANTGYNADQTVAGNAVNQGSQMANLATGNAANQANAQLARGQATQSMYSGLANAVGQGVQALSGMGQTQQPPRTNSLYTAAGSHMNSGAPVRLRNMGAR